MEGGVQLGPLGIAATNWPIVPAPSNYEDGEFSGMMMAGENIVLGGLLPQCHFVHHNRERTWATVVGSQRLTT
jgi:hypothetical protein